MPVEAGGSGVFYSVWLTEYRFAFEFLLFLLSQRLRSDNPTSNNWTSNKLFRALLSREYSTIHRSAEDWAPGRSENIYLMRRQDKMYQYQDTSSDPGNWRRLELNFN